MNPIAREMRNRLRSHTGASSASINLIKKKKKRKNLDHSLGNVDTLEDLVKEYPIWIFHPYEPIRLRWDLTVMGVMIYVLLDIPLRICFGIDLPMEHPWEILNLLIDFFFMVDIVFNFRTGFIEESQFVTNSRKIAERYLRTWFWIDLITSVPFSRLSTLLNTSDYDNNFGMLPRFLKFMKMARMFKLLRVLKLYRMMSNWEDQDSSRAATQRLLKFLCIVFLMAHIAACMWMGVATRSRNYDLIDDFDNYYGFHPESWVVREGCWEKDKTELYLFTLYWSFTTLTTVGYGDFTAWLPLEIAWTIVVMICGTSLFGYIIGNVASLMTHEDETALLVKSKIQSVLAYMRYRDFPDELARKIRRHYEYSWKRSQVYNEEEILSELPQTVRTECALYIHRDTISKVPFLSELGDDVVPILVTRLKPMLASHGDMIIQEGFFGNEMYFIAEGTLRLEIQVFFRTKYDTVLVRKLFKGEYFAEYAVIMDQPKHPVSVRAASYCDIFGLDRDHFQEFGDIFPNVYSRVMELGRERYLLLMKELNRTKTQYVMEMTAARAERLQRNSRLRMLSGNLEQEHTNTKKEDDYMQSESDDFEEDEELHPELQVGLDSVVTYSMRRRYHAEYKLRVKAREARKKRQLGTFRVKINDTIQRLSSNGTSKTHQSVPAGGERNLSLLLSKQSTSEGSDAPLVGQKQKGDPKRGSNVGVPKIVPTLSQKQFNIDQEESKDASLNPVIEASESTRNSEGPIDLVPQNRSSWKSSQQDKVPEMKKDTGDFDAEKHKQYIQALNESLSRKLNFTNWKPFRTKAAKFSRTASSDNDGFVSFDKTLDGKRRRNSETSRKRRLKNSVVVEVPNSERSTIDSSGPSSRRKSKKKLPSLKKFLSASQDMDAGEEAQTALPQRQPSLSREDDSEASSGVPQLSFFVLMRLQMWKNRAQLNLALRNMQSVEARHKIKFHPGGGRRIQQRGIVQIRRSSSSLAPPSRASADVVDASKRINNRLDQLAIAQGETMMEVKGLKKSLNDMEAQIVKTFTVLQGIAKKLDVSPSKDEPQRPHTSRVKTTTRLESMDEEFMPHTARMSPSGVLSHSFKEELASPNSSSANLHFLNGTSHRGSQTSLSLGSKSNSKRSRILSRETSTSSIQMLS